MSEELAKRLRQLKIEDYIWIIYIGIIVLSWFSNNLERDYFLYNDLDSKETYQKTLIVIFLILVIIYLYFLKDAFDEVRNVKPWDSPKKKRLVFLSFISSLLIAISGFIFLYIAIMDEEINVELAFS